MEAVLQTRGLLSLPPNPKGRVLYPSQGLKQRLFATKPKTFSGFSLSSNGVPKFPTSVSKPNGFFPKDRNLHICRAEAAAAADGQPLFGEETDKPKFLGIELATFKKIIPLGLMFFCILFNYTILRDTKDVLVVTAKGSSAEIIPFLKTWVNLPMAIGFMLLYTKLATVLSKQALFYTVILPFIAFFGAFGFVLYPLSNYIHPEAFADKLLNVLGPRFLGPLAIMRIWTFCLFYVMAELWGSVVVSVLFWGFANQVIILLFEVCFGFKVVCLIVCSCGYFFCYINCLNISFLFFPLKKRKEKSTCDSSLICYLCFFIINSSLDCYKAALKRNKVV
jgi:AAA family ATP:ADP antiporter